MGLFCGGLVSCGVVCTFFMLIDVSWCDLGVIWFSVIWCDFIEVWLNLSGFVIGVIWRLLVWFGVIFTIFGANRCFMV